MPCPAFQCAEPGKAFGLGGGRDAAEPNHLREAWKAGDAMRANAVTIGLGDEARAQPGTLRRQLECNENALDAGTEFVEGNARHIVAVRCARERRCWRMASWPRFLRAYSISYVSGVPPVCEILMRFCRFLFRALTAVVVCMSSAAASGQGGAVSAVLLSDIHFDPFHTPRLLPQLRTEPVERWPAILDSAPEVADGADRSALDAACHARGVDTPWPLLKTSLAAAHDAEANPVFVTLSGDLLAHEFSCRFHHLAPSASPSDLAGFAAKTVAFVTLELRRTYPRVPVYIALGNNDSGCGDYHESAGSPFMQNFAALRAGAAGQHGAGQKGAPVAEVSPEGDYSVALPAPFTHGRLIMLEDVFEAQQYRTCAGADDHTAEADQIGWLRTQLTRARANHEQVWVIGHIPPGIDVSSSFYRYVFRPGEMCSATPHRFLHDDAVREALLDYADVIRVAIFAHTHMDEVRVLSRGAGAGAGAQKAVIPVKLVPSVTPYFGNHPSFLVASIDPRTLVLKDWRTFVSPGPDGSTPPWTEGYRFSTAYHLPDLSAASALQLADGFVADRSGRQTRSKLYRDHFYAGDLGLYAVGLAQLWPAFACGVREDQPETFHKCLCPAAGQEAPPGK